MRYENEPFATNEKFLAIRGRTKVFLGDYFDKLGIPHKSGDAIINTTAETLLEVTQLLKIPEPRVIPPTILSSNPERVFGVYPLKNVAGTTEWFVEFGDYFLAELASNFQIPILRQISDWFLRLALTHEMYHIRAGILYPHHLTTLNESKQASASNPDYLHRRPEQGARLFAYNYIKNRKVKNLPEILVQKLTLFEAWKAIRETKLKV